MIRADRQALWSVAIPAVLIVAACGQSQIKDHQASLAAVVDPPRSGETPAPEDGGETFGLDDDQLVTMFRAAVAQTRPFAPQKVLCFPLVGDNRKTTGAPRLLRERIAAEVGYPAYPASQCSFDIFPKVIATGAQAMLYQVELEPRTTSCPMLFTAIAIFGNLGAKGQQFCLRRVRNRWIAESTGMTILS